MNSPAEQISLGKRLRALQLQQAIQLLHTSNAPQSPPIRDIAVNFNYNFILTVLTNALQGRGTAITPSLEVTHQQRLCETLHGLTGIEARIAPHGNGYAVHLD